MIVAAERHHPADAESREHQPIHVLVDRRWQPQGRWAEPEALVVEEEQGPREPEPRAHQRRIGHRPAVVEDRVVREVLLVDPAFGDGDVFRKEGGRRAERLPVRIAEEELIDVGEQVIDPAVVVVHVQLGYPVREVVLRPCHGVAGLVRQREVVQDVERDRIHPVTRNHVVGELIPDEAARRVRAGGERVEDANQLSVLREGLRKVPLTLGQRRHRRGRLRGAVFPQPFVGGHEERPRVLDRPAQHAAELAAAKITQRLAGPVREEVVGVERRVAEELVGAAVEIVGARLVDHVQHAAEAAAILRRVVRAEDLEFLDRVHRREHRDAGEPVDGGERRRHAVDDGVHHRRARAVHRVAHRVVVVADGACDPRREEDQRVDVARIQRQLENPAVVDELANRAAAGFEQRRRGADFNGIGQVADLQREVDDGRAVELHHDVRARGAPEPLQARFDAILTRRQRQRGVPSLEVGDDRLLTVGRLIRNRDSGTWNHGTARVFDQPDDGAGGRLGDEDGRANEQTSDNQGPNHAHGSSSRIGRIISAEIRRQGNKSANFRCPTRSRLIRCGVRAFVPIPNESGNQEQVSRCKGARNNGPRH